MLILALDKCRYVAEMWIVAMVLGSAGAAAGAIAGAGERHFSREPEDTVATVGDLVVLRCGVSPASSGPVQWTKDRFGLGPDTDPSLPGFPTYSMASNAEGISSE